MCPLICSQGSVYVVSCPSRGKEKVAPLRLLTLGVCIIDGRSDSGYDEGWTDK